MILHAHQVALLYADAVLAGQAAAELDAQLQDLEARDIGALQLGLVVGVVEDQRVQIAVARMEDVGDREPVARGRSRRLRPAPRASLASGITPSMQL